MAASKALTEEQELEIYARRQMGEPDEDLASAYGVSLSTIIRALKAVAGRNAPLVLASIPASQNWRDEVKRIARTMETTSRIESAIATHMEGAIVSGLTPKSGLHDLLKLTATILQSCKTKLALYDRMYGEVDVRYAFAAAFSVPVVAAVPATVATEGKGGGAELMQFSDLLKPDDTNPPLDEWLNQPLTLPSDQLAEIENLEN